MEAQDGKYGEGYLEGRQLTPRWNGPLTHLVNLAILLAVFYATWWIFQDPRGVMRLYTPFVGYMYTRWLLIIMIWLVYIFNFWPFRRSQLENWHPLLKGAIFTALCVVTMLALIKGFFEGFLGNFAMAYFNPEQMAKLPGVTRFFAEEYAALAILMFAAIASWLSPAWPVTMENAPWQKLKQPVLGFTILAFTFFLSTIIYFVTMHPHMGILYYPWQYFASISPPYWENFADTVSGNFHIAWIMSCTVVIWLYETIWERYPARLIKRPWVRRFTAFFGVIALSFCFTFFLYFVQELWWGQAIRGTRRDQAPDWRWLHVGEMMIFFLLPALYLFFYGGNWPKKFSPSVNVLTRSLIAVVAGIGLMWLYYNVAHLVLGTQKGFSHPQQFPMIPTIWFINIMLIHHWFMDNWPAWKRTAVVPVEETEPQVVVTRPFKLGLGFGVAVGVAVYFLVVWLLPVLSKFNWQYL